MQVYLDNSATTRVADEVIEIVTKVMRDDFGNPSSKHMKGVESERYIKKSAEIISGILKVKPGEIFFTSGGTESNNMALIGSAMANKRSGRHIITTRIEHDSVIQPLKFLEKEGFEVTYLGVDSDGHVNVRELEESIRPDTILVSVMYVNNEIGAVQDISAIGSAVKEKNPKTLFHADAVQAFGKYRIIPRKSKIDILSVSAHKIHGPKGAGFIYINEKVKIRPFILGGGQQKGMRSGTDNVPGVAGLGKAAEMAYDNLEADTGRMTDLKNRLTDGLVKIGEETGLPIRINSRKDEMSAPHIVSAVFAPVKSEVLLHALEEQEIYVSSGSACASNRKAKSHTLAAIGLDPKEQDCTLRFSLCRENNEEEIDYTLSKLKELLPVLSKFTSR